jgi:hypothetical protein
VTITRLWDDLGYHVTAKPIWPDDNGRPMAIEVRVVEANLGYLCGPDGDKETVFFRTKTEADVLTAEEAETFLTGQIKWDGCAHLYPREYVHICSKDDARRWGEMLTRLYDLAAEMMPGWREYLT